MRQENKWAGRSLSAYLSMHPKSEGAKTLTEARRKAFGMKKKTLECRCRQANCRRKSGYGGSNC
jgi:hypothetical protein